MTRFWLWGIPVDAFFVTQRLLRSWRIRVTLLVLVSVGIWHFSDSIQTRNRREEIKDWVNRRGEVYEQSKSMFPWLWRVDRRLDRMLSKTTWHVRLDDCKLTPQISRKLGAEQRIQTLRCHNVAGLENLVGTRLLTMFDIARFKNCQLTSSFFESLNSVSDLRLTDVDLDLQAFESICRLPNLSYLFIDGCSLTTSPGRIVKASTEKIVLSFRHADESVKRLVENVDLGDLHVRLYETDVDSEFVDILCKHTRVKSLFLSSCEFDDQDIRRLLEAFHKDAVSISIARPPRPMSQAELCDLCSEYSKQVECSSDLPCELDHKSQ